MRPSEDDVDDADDVDLVVQVQQEDLHRAGVHHLHGHGERLSPVPLLSPGHMSGTVSRVSIINIYLHNIGH